MVTRPSCRALPPIDDNPSPTYLDHAFAVMIGNYRDTPTSSPWLHGACKNNNNSDIAGHLWMLLGSKEVRKGAGYRLHGSARFVRKVRGG
ncbi:hypothetical protein CEXT_421931 [Caerostris extrusa]|uniref:Uncharacterized protein n=1 Tax=Caerostris extrusa TaxID=172846 RepID=A0AAV4NCA5_CAEEX|nr:hypothetical protein CEXT_421931 [Caerostris extrusa]